jgi:hypothetical protein
MRNYAIPFLAAVGLAMTSAASQAQSVGIAIDTDGPVYGYADFGGYGPGYYGRSYGYRSAAPARNYTGPRYGYRAGESVVEERGTSGGCGTYFYWNGDRCVDARNK